MEAKILLLSIDTTQGIPALQTHLLHILNTTQTLLNLEHCTLSLITKDGDDALRVRSSVEPASAMHPNPPTAQPPNFDAEEAFLFRQRLELGPEQIADATSTYITHPESLACLEAGQTSLEDKQESAAPIINLHLVRQSRFGRLTYTERNAIQRVLQSINRAIVSHMDYRSHDYYASMLERLLAHFCIGVIRLDQNLDIVEKSSLVDDLLESTNSYRCESNRLVKIAAREENIVEHAIDTLNNNQLPYNFVDVVATPNDGQCAIVVTKLAPVSATSSNGYRVYILCSMADHFEASELLNFWHITPAEKRVLAGLTRFGNIKKVAIELGISPNTVKSQLKSAYKKLGVDNKISLLRRFSLLRLIDALTCNG